MNLTCGCGQVIAPAGRCDRCGFKGPGSEGRADGARPAEGKRARIEVGSGPATIRAVIGAINDRRLPEVYVRDGGVVQVEEVSGAPALSGEEDSPLPVVASEVDRHKLAALLARHTFTYKRRSGKDGDGAATFDEEVTPTTQQLSAALAPKNWPGLDPLDKIAGAPLLRPDGTLLQKPGYDRATGLYLAPKVPMKPVPDRPTRRQVDGALKFLLDKFLRDFPWVEPADQANYLAVIVTPILRWFLRTLIPFVLFTATTPGSGKTILTSGPGMLYGQRVLTWPSGQDADAELRKVITSVLADPAGTVIFDNLAEGTVIKSPVLARLLTDRQWSDRLLGGNATANYANDRLWCATGNNLGLGGDMASRTVLVRLNPDMPHPEERPPAGFAIPDLDQWILNPANRQQILRSLLVLITDWTARGAPREHSVTMRQFTPWAAALGGFLAHHGIKGFLANAESARDIDDEEATWTAFLAQWHKIHKDAHVTAHELLTSADIPFGGLDQWEGLFIRGRAGKIPPISDLGRRLTGQVGRWRGSYVLRLDKDRHRGVHTYWVERRPE